MSQCARRAGQGGGIALLATWQASGKLFILQQVSTGCEGVQIEEWIEGRGVLGGMARASVKEINGLQIGKVNMSCALPVVPVCPGTWTGRWLQSCRCLGLTYFIPGQGWTGTAKAGMGEAKCKHKDEISFLPLPHFLSLSLSLFEGRHESVTALKMTDTACWSHGQEREASPCHKTAHNKHTHRYTTNTHTHTDNAK